MNKGSVIKKNIWDKILFVSSVIIFLCWLFTYFFNVYKYPVVGAIFEIIWLPMLAGIFIIPIISLFFWIKEKFPLTSLYLYSFLISVICLILVVTGK